MHSRIKLSKRFVGSRSLQVERLEPRQLMTGVPGAPLITVDTSGNALNAAVAVTPAGGYVVAWTDTSGVDGSGEGILARIYDASGNATGPTFVVNVNTSGTQLDPGVAVDPAGDIAITWSDESNYEVNARLFTSSGVALSSTDVPIAAEHVYGGGDGQAWIATNSDGTFEIGWDADPSDYPNYANLMDQQFSDSLVALNSPTVSSHSNNYGLRPYLASSGLVRTGTVGTATALNETASLSVSGADITVARSDPSVTVTTDITSLSTAPSGFVPAAINFHGDVAVAWIDSGTGNVELQPLPHTAVSASSIIRSTFRTDSANTVQWTATFSQPIGELSASNFQIESSGLTENPQILSVAAVSPTNGLSDTWTVTASTGAGAGVLGLNFVTSTGLFASFPVTNTLAGQVYAFNSTPTSTTTFSQVNVAEIIYGSATDTLTGSLSGSNVQPSGTVTATLGGTLVSSTIDANGNFSLPFNTAGLAPGAYPINVSYASDGVSMATSATLTLEVAPASAEFSNLSAPTVTVGVATVALGGAIGGGTTGVQPGGTVAITLDGTTQLAAIASDGTFSTTFDTAALPAGNHPVTYAYSGDSRFDTAAGVETMAVTYVTTTHSTATTARTRRTSAATFKVKVADATGASAASSKLDLTAIGYVSGDNATVPIKSHFRRVGKAYVLSMKLPKALARGSYSLMYTIGTDPTVRTIAFVV